MTRKSRKCWDDFGSIAHGYYLWESELYNKIWGVAHKLQDLLKMQWLLYSVGVALASSNNYWSSSEYSSNNAVNVNTNNGNVYNNNKNNNYYVRAFLRV